MNEKKKTALDKQTQALLTKVGKAIYKAREKKGLTLRDAEKLSGVSFMTISNIEKAIGDCHFGKLIKITKSLEIDLKEFL